LTNAQHYQGEVIDRGDVAITVLKISNFETTLVHQLTVSMTGNVDVSS